MRRVLTLTGIGVAAGLALLWLVGGFEVLARLAAEAQRGLQAPLAGAVRAVQAGQPAAWAGLLAVCFGYGVVHAAGPGHGKVLIGGYGVARRVPLARLVAVAVAASLAQAGVAVGLVYAGVWVVGWTRERMVGLAEGALAGASWVAVAAIGAWLVWRGGRGLWAAERVRHDHRHDHPHGADCACGHAHGPSIAQVAGLTGWRDALALVAGVAVRPCSGALFLLILTWQMGIAAAGVAGAFAMGFGVAVVTVAVAVLAVWAREGALAGIGDARVWRVLPWLEVAGGVMIAAFALGMLGRL